MRGRRGHWGDRTVGSVRVLMTTLGPAANRELPPSFYSRSPGLGNLSKCEGNETLPLHFVKSHDRLLVEVIGGSACLTNESVCRKERSIC